MDGHEWTNFVRGNTTPLAPGMCFSDEPMIAIYGEFGIRLEDCLYITDEGPEVLHAAERGDRPALRIGAHCGRQNRSAELKPKEGRSRGLPSAPSRSSL